VKVREIINQAVAREAKQDSEISIEIAGEPEAIGDPELLQRAVANLIRNAVRYAGDRGPITISCSHEPETIVLKVTDCGPGVSDSFFSASSILSFEWTRRGLVKPAGSGWV